MPLSDPLSVVRKATNILEKAGIKYLVGGSLASSLHGIPRSTQDVDIVADLNVQQVENILPLLDACSRCTKSNS
jgi:tRNA nucleotidyltransferase/poly(A) polymerase